MKDLGECRLILGMRVTRDRKQRTLLIDNEVHINKMLVTHRMHGCGSMQTPATQDKLLPADEHEQGIVNIQQYQSIVGSLNYLAQACRPDIAHAVNQLCRYASNPAPAHLVAAKRVLRYLRGTTTLGLTYSGGVDNMSPTHAYVNIDTWTDADWGGDPVDRKSTTGYIVKLNGCTVSWATRKQKTVAISTAEAEYMAISAGVQELLWIRQLLRELIGADAIALPCQVRTDNQSALSIATNDKHHDRVKHIDLKHHFVRDHVKNTDISITWTPTAQQTADILTKSLSHIKYTACRHALMDARHTYA